MGNFGYICPKCKTPINGYENCVLRHIRHGKLLGKAEGHYDGYGRVYEDRTFRNNDDENENNHSNIWTSEFKLLDSKWYEGKMYNGKPIDWQEYCKIKREKGCELFTNEMYEEWDSLEEYIPNEINSGVSAYHKVCFDSLNEEEKSKYVLSERDPEQSWGTPREKYL